MQLEIELRKSSSLFHGYRSRNTTRLAGSLRTNTSAVALVIGLVRWRRRPPRDQLARLKRDLDEVDHVVSDLRRARLRQLAAARRQRAES